MTGNQGPMQLIEDIYRNSFMALCIGGNRTESKKQLCMIKVLEKTPSVYTGERLSA
jgi:hypothetical protein